MSKGKPTKIYQAELDTFKGILIILIILGHNYFFSKAYPLWFSALYNFHVACFLLFPFLFNLSTIPFSELKNRLIRTLVPQVSFIILVLPIYFIFFVSKDWVNIISWLRDVLVALIVQNEEVLNNATGFRHFWFLPAMASLITLLFLYDRSSQSIKGLMIAFFCIWHITIGLFPVTIIRYIPWGLPIVGFIFIPGLIARSLYKKVIYKNYSKIMDLLIILVWVLLFWLCVKQRWFMGLAGDIKPRTILQPVELIFHDMFLILSFFALLRLAVYVNNTIFIAIGGISLKLFLLTPLLWQVFWMLGGKYISAETALGTVLLILSTLLLMLSTGYWLGRYIEGSWFNSLVFPRNRNQCLNTWQK